MHYTLKDKFGPFCRQFFLLLFCLMLLELTAACLLLVYEGTVGSRQPILTQYLDTGTTQGNNCLALCADWGNGETGAGQGIETGVKLDRWDE